MLRSNGEDFDKPLGGRTKRPSGAFLARQPTILEMPQQQPIEGKPGGLLERQATQDIAREYQQKCSEVWTEQEYRGFLTHGVASKVTPFQPDRIPGPTQFILKLLESWNLTTADATVLLGFEPGDNAVAEGILAGRISLRGRDVKDRIAALFRIKSLVSTLFRDGENAWMQTPVTAFGDRSPIDLLREGSMQGLLTLRQYVEHVSGL